MLALASSTLQHRGLAAAGDKVLVLGGTPAAEPLENDFIKIHTLT
jgi:hypothetical protein